jgi:anthranilate/para-aminobenzoate synthase component II
MTYTVILPATDNEKEVIQWIIDNCDSFAYMVNKYTGVKDNYKLTNFFNFTDEKEAMWFRLNWS